MDFEDLADIEDEELYQVFLQMRMDILIPAFKTASSRLKEKLIRAAGGRKASTLLLQSGFEHFTPSEETINKARQKFLDKLKDIRSQKP